MGKPMKTGIFPFLLIYAECLWVLLEVVLMVNGVIPYGQVRDKMFRQIAIANLSVLVVAVCVENKIFVS